MLALFGMIGPECRSARSSARSRVQSVPASIGAIVASKQFHAGEDEEDGEEEEKRAPMPASSS